MYSERFREFSGLISRAEKALQRAKAENVRGYGLRGVHVSCLLTLLVPSSRPLKGRRRMPSPF